MINVNEIIRQTRAEVFAACVGVLEKHREYLFKRHQQDDQKRADELLIAEAAIKQLQPAAEALEELLREAELKGLRWWFEHGIDSGRLEESAPMRVISVPEDSYKQRIAELEKAHDIVGKT